MAGQIWSARVRLPAVVRAEALVVLVVLARVGPDCAGGGGGGGVSPKEVRCNVYCVGLVLVALVLVVLVLVLLWCRRIRLVSASAVLKPKHRRVGAGLATGRWVGAWSAVGVAVSAASMLEARPSPPRCMRQCVVVAGGRVGGG